MPLKRICAACMPAALLAILTGAGCGGVGDAQLVPANDEKPAAALASALDAELERLESLPVPEGADRAIFWALKVELASMLRAQSTERFISSPPLTAGSSAQLGWHDDTSTLSWGYCNVGDYNQNSLVEVADITPLGVNWGAQSPSFPSAFPYSSELAVVDGNSNGLIEIADITPVGQNYQVRVTAYNIYASATLADYPPDPGAGNGGAELLGTVPFPEGPSPSGQRRMFSFEVTDPLPETYFWVRPTDGSTEGTPSNYCLLGAGENQPPVAQLTADPLVGDIPMLVEFDASASSDPDGEIVRFEWDWDGANNGWAWKDTGTASVVEHTFEEIAIFPATVRVTDDTGEMRTAAVEIFATTPGNDAPVAVLSADPPGGDPPLDVMLSAAGSYDLDGEILDYQWDLNGNHIYSEDGAETEARGAIAAAVTLTEIGSQTVNLKVVDDEGAQGVASIDIDVGNFPPVAELGANPYVGDAPLTVSFSAAGSSDSDGSIANYEWDLDCNGVFGNSSQEVAAEGSAEAEYTFTERGTYQPAVMVTDNEGATATESISIEATGPGWEIVTVHRERPGNLRMAIIDGHPAIAFDLGPQLYYVRSTTPIGASSLDWESPVLIGFGNIPALGVIAGNPAVAYSNIASPLELWYVRATTATGCGAEDWNQKALVCTHPEALPWPATQLLVADGNPAMAIHLGTQIWYARADTPTGSGGDDWGELVPVETVDCSHCPSAAMVEGHPAIAYQDFSNSRLRYVRSTTSDGLSAGDWSEKVTVFDVFDLYEVPQAPCLSVINGKPAISWRHHFPNYTIGDLIYQRSYTAFGNHEADWAADIIVFSSETLCHPSQLLEVNGFPAVSFIDTENDLLKYIRCDTADGQDESDWTHFESVKDLAADKPYFDGTSLAIVNGQPAIAFGTTDALMYAYYHP